MSLGYKQLQYAVVIDAGSTGSRVLAFEFHYGYLDNRLVLDKELFVQVKPGLSFYHDKPAEVINAHIITLPSFFFSKIIIKFLYGNNRELHRSNRY